MFTMLKEQMDVLEDASFQAFIEHLMAHLRQNHPAHLPATDELLRPMVLAWVDDARRWGIHTESLLFRYVEACAVNQGQRETLENRLLTYLQLYHPNLLAGMDGPTFVRQALDFAAQYQVKEEEGITWLAVILLSGKRHGRTDDGWIRSILKTPRLSEETRLTMLHEGALSRGWLSPEGGAP
jgi:hypothetical protein